MIHSTDMHGTETYQSSTNTEKISIRVLNGFDDPAFTESHWMKLQQTGDTDAVNMTWAWQRLWWKAFGRGRLMLILALCENEPVALAPLFTEAGMIYNICPKDCLDFIGDVSNPSILDAILQTAIKQVANFKGFVFYFIPGTSRTGKLLHDASLRLNLSCYDQGSLPTPFLYIAEHLDAAIEITRKKSLRRHENYFLREGSLEILHLQKAEDILPHLDEYFEQHITRRKATTAPSLFINAEQQEYYRCLTKELSETGWLRFTRINWNGKAIAFHYGLAYKGRYLYGIPSFAIELANHSPGEVLLRQLLLAAIKEGAATFDFGIGDESYKYRFATHATQLHTWGLYPGQ